MEGVSPADLEAWWGIRTLKVYPGPGGRLVFGLEKVAGGAPRPGFDLPGPWVSRQVSESLLAGPGNPTGCRAKRATISDGLQHCAAGHGHMHLWKAMGLNPWSPNPDRRATRGRVYRAQGTQEDAQQMDPLQGHSQERR